MFIHTFYKYKYLSRCSDFYDNFSDIQDIRTLYIKNNFSGNIFVRCFSSLQQSADLLSALRNIGINQRFLGVDRGHTSSEM